MECCRTCAAADLDYDRDDDTFGCVYFLQRQLKDLLLDEEENDARSLDDSQGTLLLYYGAFSKSEKKIHAVATTVVRSLRRAGVRVQWNGDTGYAISIGPMLWQRRLTEGPDDEPDDEDDGDYR
jgi:hypothetical protein